MKKPGCVTIRHSTPRERSWGITRKAARVECAVKGQHRCHRSRFRHGCIMHRPKNNQHGRRKTKTCVQTPINEGDSIHPISHAKSVTTWPTRIMAQTHHRTCWRHRKRMFAAQKRECLRHKNENSSRLQVHLSLLRTIPYCERSMHTDQQQQQQQQNSRQGSCLPSAWEIDARARQGYPPRPSRSC